MATIVRRREWEHKGAKRLSLVPALPSPPLPVSGAIAWYDLNDLASLTLSGQLISAIADRSGNGNNGTGTNNPVYGQDPTSGRGVAWFCNSAQIDTGVSASDRTSTAFVVAMLKTTAASAALLGPGGDGANEFRVNATTGQLSTLRADVASLATQSNAAVTEGLPFVATQLLSDTDITHYLNTTSETDANATAFTAGQVFRVGRAPTVGAAAADIFNGWIGEVVLYDTTLSGGDVSTMIAYLRSKWGIA